MDIVFIFLIISRRANPSSAAHAARHAENEKRVPPMPRKPKAEPANDGGAAGVRAVDRAIAILQCFTSDQPALSVIEIQKRVGLSRPTLYRLLQTLAQRDLILAEGEPQRFRLSHGVMKLSHVWLNGLEVVAVARPKRTSSRVEIKGEA